MMLHLQIGQIKMKGHHEATQLLKFNDYTELLERLMQSK